MFINSEFVIPQKHVDKNQFMRVSYEDLLQVPLKILEAISIFIERDLSGSYDCNQNNKALTAHQKNIRNNFLTQGKVSNYSPVDKCAEHYALTNQERVWKLTKPPINEFGYDECT